MDIINPTKQIAHFRDEVRLTFLKTRCGDIAATSQNKMATNCPRKHHQQLQKDSVQRGWLTRPAWPVAIAASRHTWARIRRSTSSTKDPLLWCSRTIPSAR